MYSAICRFRIPNDLGNILARQGRVDEAIERYHQTIRADPTYVQAYFNLGSNLLAQGSFDGAVAALEEAARLSLDVARIHFALGQAYLAQSRIDQAIEAYERALQLEPQHPSARQALNDALQQRGPQHAP